MPWIPLLASLGGHVSLCIFVINRLHSVGTPRGPQKVIDAVWCGWFCGGCWLIWQQFSHSPEPSAITTATLFVDTYFGLGLAVFPVAIALRLHYLTGPGRAFQRATIATRLVNLTSHLGHAPVRSWLARCATLVPLNEFLTVSVTDKRIPLPRSIPSWEGLTITHLSDLHMTGQLSLDFYHAIVDLALEQSSDLIVVTGDIVERRRCLPWIAETLSRLQAPLGVYFILGNHEERIRDAVRIRQTLTDAGLQDLGGRCVEICDGERVLRLAGTELPWHPPAPVLNAEFVEAAATSPPIYAQRSSSWESKAEATAHAATGLAPERLTILLSHSPDQLPWARRHGVDLMLAGHTHGGQVRFPWIGPVLSPSRFGITYASGVFQEPPTVMHVSRGIAADRPIRWRCHPEIARLQLVDPRHGS